MAKLHGKTLGLKASEIRSAEKLYRRRIEPERALTHELARELCALTAATRRCFGVVLDRAGKVRRVAIGDAHHVECAIDDAEATRAAGRLSGLRFVRTARKAGPIAQRDLQLLARHRLDLVARVEADLHGEPREIHLAHLLPPSPELGRIAELPPLSPHGLKADFLELMQSLEEEFRRTVESTRSARRTERAILLGVSVERRESSPLGEKARFDPARESLAELRELARSLGLSVVHERLQRRDAIDPRTVVGRGVLEELVHEAVEHEANVLVLDREISPLQARELEEATGLAVMDRTMLILSIFERRALTADGKRRVELARLRTLMPHLLGRGVDLSRQGGVGGASGGAMRGSGETKLEEDRRALKRRIQRLERELERTAARREERRKRRRRAERFTIALVGYTNAGKSTLFNALAREEVRAEDLLFATLDTTTRRVHLPGGTPALLIDTVGFLRDLPPYLMDAFRATLEEIATADLLLHVIDASNPAWPRHLRSVQETLAALECAAIPTQLFFNKADRADPAVIRPHAAELRAALGSALQAEDVSALARELEGFARQNRERFPQSLWSSASEA
ncbi:MAG: GTPase HflX [Planctomycetes bacterium]|nr:GTPase HflX [Planctomycetota bacterium]